jgi:hypothetical protein
MHSLVLSLG